MRPNLSSTREALDFILKSIEKAGYKPGEDIYLALDCAATEYFKNGNYVLAGEDKILSSDENVEYLAALVDNYPIISIEDGMSEDDWDGWKALTEALGDKVQLVGDDLFVTNPERLADGIEARLRQFDPGQGQPDRHAVRDPGRRRYGAPGAAIPRDVAPVGRDRGCHDCRSGGGDELRADQDRLAVALRPAGEVQPADPDRRDAG